MDSPDPLRKPHQFQNLRFQQPLMSPETERIVARFILDCSPSPSREGFRGISKNSDPGVVANPEPGTDFMASPPTTYQGASLPPLPNHGSKAIPSAPEMHDGAYTAAQGMMGSANNSNLFSHSSSLAGLFYNLNPENGIRNLGSISGSDGEAYFPSLSSMKCPINFSSATIPENGSYSEARPGNDCIFAGIPVGSLEEIVGFTDNFSNLISAGEDDMKIFSGLNVHETQGEVAFHAAPPGLSSHMSLAKTAAVVSSMEKSLMFRDSGRAKIRAKRGCATHPRSIAERMRRTRISERMRKLQELVPNMDEKTSTADLLDFAVDYIKGLQNQVRRLSENRA